MNVGTRYSTLAAARRLPLRCKAPYNNVRPIASDIVHKPGQSSRVFISTFAPRLQALKSSESGSQLAEDEGQDEGQASELYFYSRPDLDKRPDPEICLLEPGLRTDDPEINRRLNEPLPTGYRRALWIIPPASANTGIRGLVRRRYTNIVSTIWPSWVSKDAILDSIKLKYDVTIIPAHWVSQDDRHIYVDYATAKERDAELAETIDRWRKARERRERMAAKAQEEKMVGLQAEKEAESGSAERRAGAIAAASRTGESKVGAVNGVVNKPRPIRRSPAFAAPPAVNPTTTNPYASYISRPLVAAPLSTPVPPAPSTPISATANESQPSAKAVPPQTLLYRDLLKAARGYDAALLSDPTPPPPSSPLEPESAVIDEPAPAAPAVASKTPKFTSTSRATPDFLEPPPSKEERYSAKKARKRAQRLADIPVSRVEEIASFVPLGHGPRATTTSQSELPTADLLTQAARAEVVEEPAPYVETEEEIERWLREAEEEEARAMARISDGELANTGGADVVVAPASSDASAISYESTREDDYEIDSEYPNDTYNAVDDGSPPLTQQMLQHQAHIDEVRALLSLGGFDPSFPRNLPALGADKTWDDTYASAWPFLHTMDSIGGKLDMGHFAPSLINFDHTKLPPLLPIVDKALRREAVTGNTSWARLRQRSLAWTGDRVIDTAISKMLRADITAMEHVVTVRDLIAANKTLAWLAVHYGFVNQFPPYLLANDVYGQKTLATAFEAWIGAAEEDYDRRGKLQEFSTWLKALFSFEVWPEAFAELYHLQKKEPPAIPKGARPVEQYMPDMVDGSPIDIDLSPSAEDVITPDSQEDTIRRLEDEIDDLKLRMARLHYRVPLQRKSTKQRFLEVKAAQAAKLALAQEEAEREAKERDGQGDGEKEVGGAIKTSKFRMTKYKKQSIGAVPEKGAAGPGVAVSAGRLKPRSKGSRSKVKYAAQFGLRTEA